jgi:hypothetical protein
MEEVLDSLGGVFLVSSENERSGALGKADFVHVDHRAEADHAHVGVFGDEVHDLLEGILQFVQVFLVQASVDDEEENGRACRGHALEVVLDRGEVGDELGGEIRFGNVLRVVCGELVSAGTEGTDPDFGVKVDLDVWVQNAAARVASHGIVRKRGRELRHTLQRRIQAADGDTHPRSFDARSRPNIPRKANTVSRFDIMNIQAFLHDG